LREACSAIKTDRFKAKQLSSEGELEKLSLPQAVINGRHAAFCEPIDKPPFMIRA
jgi:hypothetical protein